MMTSFLFLGQLSFTTVCFCCELSEEVIVFFTHVSSCLFFCVKKLKKRNYANACFFHCIPLYPFLSFSLLVPGKCCNWLEKYWSVKEESYSEKV